MLFLNVILHHDAKSEIYMPFRLLRKPKLQNNFVMLGGRVIVLTAVRISIVLVFTTVIPFSITTFSTISL